MPILDWFHRGDHRQLCGGSEGRIMRGWHWYYRRLSNWSYSACEPIQNQMIVSSSRSPTARQPMPMRTE